MEKEFLLKYLNKRLFLHLLFWSVFSLFFSIGFVRESYSAIFILLNFIGIILLYIFYVYTTLYFIYNYLVKKKHYFLAAFIFIILLLGATTINAWTFNISNSKQQVVSYQNFVPFYLFLAAFTLALKIARQSYLSLQREIDIKEDLLQQKEYFLRSQIHPHFLFNTLNNFYGLALEKSSELPDLMIRLSNILRHQIYHSESSYISLSKEINYLKDYIELEKIRHEENLSFQFLFPAATHDNLFVTPSIFIVFFENAFKHSNDVSSQSIHIQGYLKIEQDQLDFYLENSSPNKLSLEQDENSGFGLQNVKKRLELLGKDNYDLHIENKKHLYSVSLKIKLQQNDKKS